MNNEIDLIEDRLSRLEDKVYFLTEELNAKILNLEEFNASKNKFYVVTGSCSKYEDAEYWVSKIFSNERDAQSYILKLNNMSDEYRRNKSIGLGWSSPEFLKKLEELDPKHKYSSSYGPPYYSYEGIEIE